MKFSRKIAGSFLVLTLLTAVAGGLGLYFTSSILAILQQSSLEGEPLVEGVEDLSEHVRRAMFLSEEIAANDNVDSIRQLREELSSLQRNFANITVDTIQESAGEIVLDELDKALEEHKEFTYYSQLLIKEHLSEIEAQLRLQSAVDVSKKRLKELTASLHGFWAKHETGDSVFEKWKNSPDSIGLIRQGDQKDDQPSRFPASSSAHSLFLLQQTIMDLMIFQDEIFKLNTVDHFPKMKQQIETGFKDVARYLEAASMSADVYAARTSDARSDLEHSFLRWEDSVLGTEGLLAAYEAWRSLNERVNQLKEVMKREAAEALSMLDRLSAITEKLVLETKSPSILKATPALLILTIVLTLAVSIVLSVLFARNFAGPVEKLIHVTRAVANGDFTHRVHIRSGDELDFLAKSFNYMVEEIESSEESIKKLNAELGQRVRARTSELENEVHERTVAEKALRDSEAQYRTIVDSFPNGIIALFDKGGRCMAIGGQALKKLDVDAVPCVGKQIGEIWPPSIAKRLEQHIPDIFGGSKRSFEVRAERIDWLVYMVPNANSGESVETLTILAVDITNIKDAERRARENQEKLIQADKLASLGVLVAGVAHEINNPNQVVMSGGQLLSRMWKDTKKILDERYDASGDFPLAGVTYSEMRDTMGEYYSGIVDSANRIESIVRALKDYSRQETEEMSDHVDINSVVRSAVTLVSSMVQKRTNRLSVELRPDIPRVWGNYQRLEQVIVNLVQNAAQALSDTSKGISIWSDYDTTRKLITVTVRDEGKGISPDNVSKIKDPFFTTKRSQGGTGLGLSVSTAIVEKHGGSLEISSQVGRGTAVTLSLPATSAAPERKSKG